MASQRKIRMVDPADIIEDKIASDAIKPKFKKDNFHKIDGLPSNYLLYPEGTEIFGRPLNVKEVKVLSEMDETNVNEIVNRVFSTATYGYPVEKMLEADKFYIIFWLRANTYKNSGYEIPFTCSKCEKETHYDFNVDAINVKRMSSLEDIEKEITLPDSQNQIRVKLLTVEDRSRVEGTKKMFSRSSVIEIDEDILEMAAKLLSVNGQDVPNLKDRYDYIVSLSAPDYAYLDSFMSHLDIGVIPVIEAKCGHPGCGGMTLVEVRFQSDFFIPKYKF